MQERVLHIVSFDNPYPPVYGGIVEVFHKLKPLHEQGISIHLHCFTNQIPDDYHELQQVTSKVYFYRNAKKSFDFLSYLPFSVRSRNSRELLVNLEKIPGPILFEGLKTAYLVHKDLLPDRRKFLRLHNVEHHYFAGIAQSESSSFRKWAYKAEAIKFASFEDVIQKFDKVFALSQFENDYTNKKFGNSVYIPVFHGNDEVLPLEGTGKYALYHGDLRMSDNIRAVRTLIRIFNKIPDMDLVIASGGSEKLVKRLIGKAGNISFKLISNFDDLQRLLVDAHVNVVLSYQKSGTKLKLMASLFNSRHCIINDNIIDDPAVSALCEMANSDEDIAAAIKRLKNLPYRDFEQRREVLENHMNDFNNARLIIDQIW